MSSLHMVRMVFDRGALMRFAAGQGLLRIDDEGNGYLVHAWLAALFGSNAPKPFRVFEEPAEVLGYSCRDASALLDHASAFASPLAWEVLRSDSLASKPMPSTWRQGARLAVEVLACPVTRKDGHEKDVFLRALDRVGDEAGSREQVYIDWFRRQWSDALVFEHVTLTGLSRRRMLRRTQSTTEEDARRTRGVERPVARFHAAACIDNVETFARLLERGLGRHRAFGLGMVLLRPGT